MTRIPTALPALSDNMFIAKLAKKEQFTLCLEIEYRNAFNLVFNTTVSVV
mgnify:FL=1|jgi:hypothetical protein